MTKKLLTLTLITIIAIGTMAQTTLTEAVEFHVKTIYGEPIYLFPLLDDENKIVIIDFFSTTCGPCQEYAADFQACYEKFGFNESNTYFMGINWGNDNWGVHEFDSIYGLTFPSASGNQGGGNIVYQDYEILSYPTIIVITPDHTIVEQYIWYPDEETITAAVIAAGGIIVDTEEVSDQETNLIIYPNPVSNSGKIDFFLSETSEVSISILNLLGQEVTTTTSKQFQEGKASLDFSVHDLKNGYYFIKIYANGETIATSRISVSH